MTTNPAVLRLQNRHTGEVLEVSRELRNGEAVFRLSGTLPAHREGPPLHIHYLEDEEGFVTAGTLSAELDGQRFTFGRGETVRLPKGVPHRWWNDGDLARCEGIRTAPGGAFQSASGSSPMRGRRRCGR